MMTARNNADDIISASAPRTRGAWSEPVAAAEFRAALSGLTCSEAPTEPLAYHRQHYATTRVL